jgi:hypothetical protein
MITARQEKNFFKDFTEICIDSDLLTFIAEWISENLDPEDVFTQKALDQWANDNGYETP